MTFHPGIIDFFKKREGAVKDKDGNHVLYPDCHGVQTIGYGHNTEVDDVARAVTMTEDSALELLQNDLMKHDRELQVLFGKRLKHVPHDVYKQVLSMKFRGDLGPRARRYLMNGNWHELSREILRSELNSGELARVQEASHAFKVHAKKKDVGLWVFGFAAFMVWRHWRKRVHTE